MFASWENSIKSLSNLIQSFDWGDMQVYSRLSCIIITFCSGQPVLLPN